MYTFGKSSTEKLLTCRNELQFVAHEAIKLVDFSIIHGYRTQEQQDLIYAQARNGTGAGGVGAFVVFPCRMFASPTITTYNPSAANANWRAGAVDDAVVTVDDSEPF